MLTPKELFDKSGLEDEYARLPAVLGVGKGKLRQCQHDAIQNIELSFKRGLKRCLLDLATGSGKHLPRVCLPTGLLLTLL